MNVASSATATQVTSAVSGNANTAKAAISNSNKQEGNVQQQQQQPQQQQLQAQFGQVSFKSFCSAMAPLIFMVKKWQLFCTQHL